MMNMLIVLMSDVQLGNQKHEKKLNIKNHLRFAMDRYYMCNFKNKHQV